MVFAAYNQKAFKNPKVEDSLNELFGDNASTPSGDQSARRVMEFPPGYQPSAVDFLLGELCEAARSARRNETLAVVNR